MSAYMVSDNHIHALVGYMIRERIIYYPNDNARMAVTADNAEEVGQILVDENYRSVNQRYQERTEGHFGKAPTYKFKGVRILPDALAMLKACNCYEYQAGENDDWEQSVAYKIVNAIKEHAIRKLPGYDDAPWGID